MRRRFSFHRRLFPYVLLGAAVGVVLAALLGTTASARSTVQTAPPSQASQGECTSRICTFDLQVNPGLQPGKPFACPAIQNARARITITNRFVTGAQNDIMVLTAKGLPKNTGFDMFLVQHSPLDQGTFPGFGFGWYQSDIQRVQSNPYLQRGLLVQLARGGGQGLSQCNTCQDALQRRTERRAAGDDHPGRTLAVRRWQVGTRLQNQWRWFPHQCE